MKKLFRPFIPILLFAGLISVASSINQYKPRLLVEAESVSTFLGETINVEKRSLSKDGEVKEATCKIYTPSDVAFNADKFVADEPGIYKVVYYAYFGMEEVSETVSYLVERKGVDVFTLNGDVTGEFAKYSHAIPSDKNVNGVKFHFGSGSNIVFNNLIDVNDLTKETPFLEYIVDPEKSGEADFKTIKIRLIDSIDPNVYVEVLGADSGLIDTEGTGTYFRAGFKGGVYAGFEGDYFNRIGKWHYASYGQALGSSFRALPKSNPSTFAKLYFDYSSFMVLGFPRVFSNETDVINDLDAPEIYPSNPFQGFPSGKCYIQLSCSDFNNAKGHVIVRSVAGLDLTKEILTDTTGPVINVDYNGQNPSSLPKAVVGKPFKTFDAVAVDDFDTNLKVTKVVKYFDIDANKYIDYSLSKDGYFTPNEIGTYVIYYTAHDRSGNEAKTVRLNILASNSVSDMTFEMQSTIESTIFEPINLAPVESIVVKGGSGNKHIERKVLNPKGEEVILSLDNSFTPDQVGEYQIIYDAYDYLGNHANEIQKVNVQGLSTPKFLSYSSIAPVLINGFTYEIKEPHVVETYNNEVCDVKTKIIVNGSEVKDSKFVATGSQMEVIYKAEGKTGTSEIKLNIDVVDGQGGSKQENYFYTNATKELRENDVYITSGTSFSNVVFANRLAASDLSLYFFTKNLDNMDIVLKDTDNENLSLTFTVAMNNGEATITSKTGKTAPFAIRSGEMLFEYKNDKHALYDASGEFIMSITEDDNGNEFNGFGDTVYVTFVLRGSASDSAIAVTKINNQPLGHLGNPNYVQDEAKPQIVYDTRLEIEQLYGDNFNCPKIRAYDVLSEVDEVTIKVSSPEGMKIFESDGEHPETFKIDQYGGYTIAFTASDTNGNSAKQTKKVFVYDDVAPTLTVKDLERRDYKVGDTVALPTYEASDNSDNVYVDVILILPDNEMRNLLHEENGEVTYILTNSNYYPSSFRVDNNHFRTEQVGTYTLRYVAYDEQYNKTVVELKFIVR